MNRKWSVRCKDVNGEDILVYVSNEFITRDRCSNGNTQINNWAITCTVEFSLIICFTKLL